MTDKFTLGPWLTDGSTVYAEEDGHNIFYAVVQDHLMPDDELKANAALMSAAPDLLESLRYMVLSAENDWIPDASAIHQAKAAIKKATNQSN